jgi:hypothetical protein
VVGKTASEVRLIVPYAQPVPDIIVSRAKIEQPYPTKPVEICVEIISPEDRLKEVIKGGVLPGLGRAVLLDHRSRYANGLDCDAGPSRRRLGSSAWLLDCGRRYRDALV